MKCDIGRVGPRACVAALALWVVAGMTQPAHATNFSVLLQEPGGGGGGCGSDVNWVNLSAQGGFEQLPNGIMRMRKRPEILFQEWDSSIQDYITTNPLYENNGTSGQNPFYESEHLKLIPNVLEMSIVPDALLRTWRLDLSMEVIAQPIEVGAGIEAYALMNISHMIDAPAEFRAPQMSDFFATRSFILGEEGMRVRQTRTSGFLTDPDAGFSVMGGSWNVSFVPSPGAAGLAIAGGCFWMRRRR